MRATIAIGNPWKPDEASPPKAPWADAELTSKDAVGAYLDHAGLPRGEGGGFWFAFHDVEGHLEGVRLFTDVARPERVVPMIAGSHGLYTLRFPAPEVDRVEYSFQLVHPGGGIEWALDPRNARSVQAPFGSKSEALADTYVAPSYASPADDMPRGTLRSIPVPGPRGSIRDAWVWRAAGHRLEDALPLLIFLDGGDYLLYAGMRRVLDALVHEGRIAPCRALFLPPNDRFDEYSANNRTGSWLTAVLPRVLARYMPIPPDAADRIGIGASLGGLALLHAHWTHPGFFGRLVLQSGSFFHRDSDSMVAAFSHFGRICRFVRGLSTHRRVPPQIDIRMTCGLAEENLVNNRRLRDRLAERGQPVTLLENRDAHNWVGWRDSIGSELEAFLPSG